MSEPTGVVVLYTTEDGRAQVKLRAIDGSAWLTQAQLAELFQVTPQAITQHVGAIYQEGELLESATCNDYLQVRSEGGREVQRTLRHYNLEVILAVGYRVRSARGTQFRRWATTVLRDYLVKGFAMDDQKLKGAQQWDYFDEWLERIRHIRTSQTRFYQKCATQATGGAWGVRGASQAWPRPITVRATVMGVARTRFGGGHGAGGRHPLAERDFYERMRVASASRARVIDAPRPHWTDNRLSAST